MATFVAAATLALVPIAKGGEAGHFGDGDLRSAAEKGDAAAQFCLGARYYAERYKDPANLAEAQKWFRLSAAQDNAQAEDHLGAIYFLGRGVPQDYVEAANWYRRAAAHGNRDAQERLAAIYRDGKGVAVDPEVAKRWSDAAAHAVEPPGCDAAAVPGDGPASQAKSPRFADYPDLRREAEKGDSAAQFRLGKRLYDVRRRDEAQDAEAQKWLRLSAAQGNAEAEDLLGSIYYFGRGAPQDYGEAANWYRRAADHGNLDAMTRLGRMYTDGRGVPRDLDEARKWNRQAYEVTAGPEQRRILLWFAGILLGVAAFAGALTLLRRDGLSGWKRFVVAGFVHVVGIALLLNACITYGLPELLFPKCSYGFLAASCSDHYGPGLGHIAESLRNWQTSNLLFRFMGGLGLVLDVLAAWYVVHVVRQLRSRRRFREKRQ